MFNAGSLSLVTWSEGGSIDLVFIGQDESLLLSLIDTSCDIFVLVNINASVENLSLGNSPSY